MASYSEIFLLSKSYAICLENVLINSDLLTAFILAFLFRLFDTFLMSQFILHQEYKEDRIPYLPRCRNIVEMVYRRLR